MQEKQWDKGEFAILVSTPRMSDDALSVEIDRSPSAIAVVREGICMYHRTNDSNGILSRMMVTYLDTRRGDLLCHKCKARI
jgi:hypothetical protein